MTSVNLMHEVEHPKLVCWGSLKGKGGERGGRGESSGKGVQDEGDTCIPIADSCLCIEKTIAIL